MEHFLLGVKRPSIKSQFYHTTQQHVLSAPEYTSFWFKLHNFFFERILDLFKAYLWLLCSAIKAKLLKKLSEIRGK